MYFGTGEKTFNADAVRGGGVWKSIDHGVTWNLLANTTGFINVSRVLCDAAGNVYVTTIGASGIQRSINGGTSWTNITPAGLTSYVTEMRISSAGRLHIVCGYVNTGTSGYRFTDIPSTVASGTWTSPTTTFPTSINSELTVDATGNTLYALPSNASYFTPTIYKSIDGGANWAATLTSPPSTSSEPSINLGQGWYDLAIGVDPANPNNVIAGGLNFYRSIDGGATWVQITRWAGLALNYVHADHHTVVWNGSQVLLGTDGGIFYSNNNGLSFVDRNDGLRIKQFYSCAIHPTTTNYFLAGAQDNGCHSLTSPGLGGSTEILGGDGAFVHIDQDEPQYQFGAYVYNQYRRSTDGGANWSNINFSTSLGQFINPTDYDDVNNILYCGYSSGNYLRWNNPQTGTSGTSVSVGAFSGSVTHVMKSPNTAHRVFFGTSGGSIVRVENAQATPTATAITGTGMNTTPVSCVAVGTTDNNLIATFSNYGSAHVWVSTTGGGAAGWTNISGNLPDIPVRWAMFYPEDNTKAILATEMGVYETSLINGGATAWVQNASFPVVKTNMLQYRPGDGTVAAATHGRGLWTSIIPFTTPYIHFVASNSYYTYNYQPEVTTSTTGCRYYKDYTINMKIDMAPVGDAVVTLTPSGSGTQGIDYDFTTNGNFAAPSNVLTFPNGSTAAQAFTLRVYNDAEVESAESVTFTYTVGGGTNAQAAPSSTSYTFTFADNDPVPTTTPIETTLGNNKTEYEPNNGTYYFYSSASGNLINMITGATGNLGCVSSSIFEAGNTWQVFDAGERSQKVFDISPATNPGSTYTISLYFTAAELGAYSATPGSLKIAKTTAATIAGANASNTIRVPTTFAAYNGGFVFTATFTGFSKFFLVNNAVTLPVSLVSFTGTLNNNNVLLNWNTASQQNFKNFDVEKSTDGVTFYKIGSVAAAANSSAPNSYSFHDLKLSDNNYYRLRINDMDGSNRLSQVVLIRYTVPKQTIWVVNNPFTDYIDLRFAKQSSKVKLQLLNSNGGLILEKNLNNVSGQIRLPLSNNLSSGVYVLKAVADGEAFIKRVIRQ